MSFEEVLDKQMLAMSALQAAKSMQLAQSELFRQIFHGPTEKRWVRTKTSLRAEGAAIQGFDAPI